MKKKIFLSLPYSSNDPSVIEYRYQISLQVSAKLLLEGHIVFSPISTGHPLTKLDSMIGTDWKFWEDYCKTLIDLSDEVYVVQIDGVDSSIGVSGEILYATTKGIKVTKYFI